MSGAFSDRPAVIRLNLLSPIMARRRLLTLKERAARLAASKLPIPLREATS